MLLRLSTTAKKCFGQAGRSHPADEEDLTMLGKGRQPPKIPNHRSVTRPTDVAAGPDSFSAMTATAQSFVPVVQPPLPMPIAEVEHIPFLTPLEETPEPINDFDFDAFLANFGLASDVTDLFGDLNGDWSLNDA